MAIYRGPGGAGDATADATNAASVAEGFADDAAVSAAAAVSSAADALAAQTAAEAAQTAAEAAQTAAETAETNAETAETNAETAQAAAEAARDAALSHAGNAESFADAAEISAGNAETSYQNTLAIFGNAEDIAAAVLAAETSAGNAEAFATAAEVSAGNAETFSLAASGYADTALSHAGNADTSATAAASSASAAATSASNAAASYDAFDDRYLGSKASAPSVDNDGNALLTGALYWNSSANQLYVWDGSAWDEAAFNATGAVTSFNTRSGAVTLNSTDVTDALTYTPLGSADIGVTVQAYDATYLVDADIGVTVQGYDINTAKLDVAQTFTATQNFADNFIQRPTIQDYAIEGSAIGNVGATRTFDLETANFFSATVDQASAFTFSNPPASGDFGAFVLELTNGGAFVVTWPASVDWPGGTAPTLTTAGVDQLVFTTKDGGTTWYGFTAGLDIKSP
jgi:hypothetical protein